MVASRGAASSGRRESVTRLRAVTRLSAVVRSIWSRLSDPDPRKYVFFVFVFYLFVVCESVCFVLLLFSDGVPRGGPPLGIAVRMPQTGIARGYLDDGVQ